MGEMKWISSRKAVPAKVDSYSENVLVVVRSVRGKGRQVYVSRYGPSGWSGIKDSDVTHWMHFPDPPEEENQSNA